MNILILTAMKSELEDILKNSQVVFKDLDHGHYLSGKNNLFLMNLGVGPISAGIQTQKYITQFDIHLVVLVGLCGGIKNGIQIGDHIVAEKIFQHDAICEFEDKIEYMAPGQLHLSVLPGKREKIYITTDSNYSQKIGRFLEESGQTVHYSDIVSGSSFIGKTKSKMNLLKNFPSASAVEMESIGIALASKNNQIPFVVVKTVADSLDDAVKNYSNYLDSEKEKTARIINFFLEDL